MSTISMPPSRNLLSKKSILIFFPISSLFFTGQRYKKYIKQPYVFLFFTIFANKNKE